MIHHLEDVTDWLPFGRIVIIDKHRLTPLGQLGEHVIHDFVLLFLGDLMQKEEAANQVVIDRIRLLELGGIATDDFRPIHPGKLARAMLDLDRRHIGKMENSLGTDLLRCPGNQIAIHMGQLPDAHSRLDFVEIGTHQALVVKKQQDANDPVMVQYAHPFGVDIRPVVHLGHIRWNTFVIRVNGERRVIVGHWPILSCRTSQPFNKQGDALSGWRK